MIKPVKLLLCGILLSTLVLGGFTIIGGGNSDDERRPGEVIVTFDTQTWDFIAPTTRRTGQLYGTLPTASPRYDFIGWFTAPEGGTQVVANTVVREEDDHTLYAQWFSMQEESEVPGDNGNNNNQGNQPGDPGTEPGDPGNGGDEDDDPIDPGPTDPDDTSPILTAFNPVLRGARVEWDAVAGATSYSLTYTFAGTNRTATVITNAYTITRGVGALSNFRITTTVAGRDRVCNRATGLAGTVNELGVFNEAIRQVSQHRGVEIRSQGTSTGTAAGTIIARGHIVANHDTNGNVQEIYRLAYSKSNATGLGASTTNRAATGLKRSYFQSGSSTFHVNEVRGNASSVGNAPNFTQNWSGATDRSYTMPQFQQRFQRNPLQVFLYTVNQNTIQSVHQSLTWSSNNQFVEFSFNLTNAAGNIMRHEVESIGNLIRGSVRYERIRLTFRVDRYGRFVHFVTDTTYLASMRVNLGLGITFSANNNRTNVVSTFTFQHFNNPRSIPWSR